MHHPQIIEEVQKLDLTPEQTHALIVIGLILGIVCLLIWLTIRFFFCLSVFSTYRLVPKKQRTFPTWFCWMMMIPLVSFIFEWIMLPFGIPGALKRCLMNNRKGLQRATSLTGLGLSFSILGCLFWVPILSSILMTARLVLFIIYWVKIVTLKNFFLTVALEIPRNIPSTQASIGETKPSPQPVKTPESLLLLAGETNPNSRSVKAPQPLSQPVGEIKSKAPSNIGINIPAASRRDNLK